MDWLAERGYDKLMGARPLSRLIAEKIKKPLAEEVLFGKLMKGGSIKIELNDGELSFCFGAAKSKNKARELDSALVD
jgi:ATP-dependent Clp protease ATP-binding subunit ClpA